MSALAGVLRRSLRALGFDLVRFQPALDRPFPVLPLLVRDLVAMGGPFYFVQVGANDGVLDDPIRALVLQHALPGLLIEPLPDLFQRLQANYRGQPQLAFENAAVLPATGERTLYRVRPDAPVSDYWQGLASFTRANLEAQGVPARHIHAQSVRGAPLGELIRPHVAPGAVSLLQVDTEGYDFAVLQSAFAAGMRPAIINYEHCWLSPDVRLAARRLLDAQGYAFLEVGKDTVAVRETAAAPGPGR
ncbi:MAG: FkbM family methyltransferase [Gemmatimonadetes bacterium]|nr:FkbM family methyltransferase [Gemmatimonadota bacterium]